MIRIFLLCFFITFSVISFAQPALSVYPSEMVFEDQFNRIENVKLINDGDSNLIIDSISYNSNWYFVRFNVDYSYPLIIAPNDTIEMDCIMASYYQIPSSDTLDVMHIHSNAIEREKNVNIRIRYFDDDFKNGEIKGQITYEGMPVENAVVRFLYKGNYIIKWVYTNAYGNYSVSLPPGSYLIAAEKDSFYVTFYDKKYDPFSANYIRVTRDSSRIVNINLAKMIETDKSVSGEIHDDLSKGKLFKGVAVVRRGRFNPSKINTINAGNFTGETYSAFVDYQGKYHVKNILQPGYYYVQSFSDYFTPTYFSNSDYPSLWQNADSIFIDADITGKNIYLDRDSSTGAGLIEGKIIFNSMAADFNDVIVYANSILYDQIFNYSYVDQEGNFSVINLPYGEYELIVQKLGYDDFITNKITISPGNSYVKDIPINYNILASVENENIPEEITLYQNYPNPFNPATKIELYLPTGEYTTLKIYNILGEEIASLFEGFLKNGNHKFNFNGDGLSSGTYIVILNSGETIKSRKILLIK